jgi:hypothetical protein
MPPFMLETSPIERYEILGHTINVRRDDLAFLPPLPPNAKMAALYNIVKHAYVLGFDKVVMFAKKQQGIPYAIGLPPICKQFGMKCFITYPSTGRIPMPQWLYNLQIDYPDTFPVRLHPNMITINVNQSKKIAEKYGAYFIPFGFDSEISVNTHSEKFGLPNYFGTLVMSTMTGMILAGVLKQIYTRGYKVDRVYGISSGRSEDSIMKSMEKYIGRGLFNNANLSVIEAFKREYIVDQSDKTLYPFPMHPDYEAKAWNWMINLLRFNDLIPNPIWFINTGR